MGDCRVRVDAFWKRVSSIYWRWVCTGRWLAAEFLTCLRVSHAGLFVGLYVWVLIRQDPGPVTVLSYVSSGLYGVCSEVNPWVFVFKHRVSLFLTHFEIHFANQGFHRNQWLKTPKEKWRRVLQLQQCTESHQQWIWSLTINRSREVVLLESCVLFLVPVLKDVQQRI